RPEPLPTATSALKLKRRPPLTTFATRLMEMTFSMTSLLSRLSRSRSCLANFSSLELQPALAGACRQRRDPAVITVAAAIEDDLLDPLLLGPLGQHAPHRLRLGDAARIASGARHVPDLEARRRHQRRSGRVVDDLRVDVQVAAEDRHAPAAGR